MKRSFVYKNLFYFFLFFLWGCNIFNNNLKIKALEAQALPKDINVFKRVSSVWLLNLEQAKQIAKPQNKYILLAFFSNDKISQAYLNKVFSSGSWIRYHSEKIVSVLFQKGKGDVNTAQNLRNKYDISDSQAFVVLDSQGNFIAKFNSNFDFTATDFIFTLRSHIYLERSNLINSFNRLSVSNKVRLFDKQKKYLQAKKELEQKLTKNLSNQELSLNYLTYRKYANEFIDILSSK